MLRLVFGKRTLGNVERALQLDFAQEWPISRGKFGCGMEYDFARHRRTFAGEQAQNVLDPAVVRGELYFGEFSLTRFSFRDAALSHQRRMSKVRFDTLQESVSVLAIDVGIEFGGEVETVAAVFYTEGRS